MTNLGSAGAVTFTLDVEDYTADGSEPRALATTRRILAFLGERGVRGTFFVVGTFAAAHTELLTDIVDSGHELALHGYHHLPLTETDANTFRREVGDIRKRMEDVVGRPVIGFRAPTFSLVPQTQWATDVLVELGFEYSSSVLPARSPLYGWPGRPRTPHRWPSGLLELPCPVATVGPLTNPYLGGIYFRVLPWRAVRFGLSRSEPDELLWAYAHPYDFDPGEPFQKRPDLGPWKSRLQWVNRRRMFDRVDRLYATRAAGAPLAERIATVKV
jgi:polysaccharide deacetylase family protein (PEP-CTERM system associated)